MSFLTSLLHFLGAAIAMVVSAPSGDRGVLAAVLILGAAFAYPAIVLLHVLVATILSTLRRLWVRLVVATAANLLCLGVLALAFGSLPPQAVAVPLAIAGQLSLSLLAWRVRYASART